MSGTSPNQTLGGHTSQSLLHIDKTLYKLIEVPRDTITKKDQCRFLPIDPHHLDFFTSVY